MQSPIETTRFQVVHAVAKRSHTWEHHGISTPDYVWVGADLHRRTDLRKAILHAPEIPSAVIHNGQHGLSLTKRLPWW